MLWDETGIAVCMSLCSVTYEELHAQPFIKGISIVSLYLKT